MGETRIRDSHSEGLIPVPVLMRIQVKDPAYERFFVNSAYQGHISISRGVSYERLRLYIHERAFLPEGISLQWVIMVSEGRYMLQPGGVLCDADGALVSSRLGLLGST